MVMVALTTYLEAVLASKWSVSKFAIVYTTSTSSAALVLANQRYSGT